MLSSPLRHQDREVMRVFNAPTMKSAMTAVIAEAKIPRLGGMKKYGSTGMIAPTRYDDPTTAADFKGGSKSPLNPSSSLIMTLRQRSGSAVIWDTIWSSNSPAKPLLR